MESLAYNLNTREISNKYRTSLSDKVRVCFYGRVSTQHEAQINALDNQLQWYDSILKDHPNWEKIAVYTDKGVTGTQAKKRHGFMEMISDASKGKFDLVCTREVSRFARNTLDSLNYTRKLRNMGVEVFFYNDNIWSCESDGELRLTIMSAMSQEESKHISDRVLAGQMISRKKGVLYGNGNILGYRLVKGESSAENTYAIEEEEAETVRMIYDFYLSGLGVKAIASKLMERKRRKVSGSYKWEPSYILRILDNKTYAGYIGYNKSYTKNFLEHTRVNITDKSQYKYIKGNFPPIISEEKWTMVQAMKNRKVTCFHKKVRGKPLAKDKWVRHLFCECGSTYKRYKWRTNKTGEECYGYQCRNQVNYRKRSFHVKNGMDGTGYCDVPSICEWKLDFMAKSILKRLWKDQDILIQKIVQDVGERYVEKEEMDGRQYEIDKLKREQERLFKRKENLMDMLLEELIDKREYERKHASLANRLNEVEQELNSLTGVERMEEPVKLDMELEKIREFLDKACDLEQKKISDELINALVTKIIPTEDGIFKWYVQSESHELETTFQAEEYVLCDKFSLNFEMARAYRKTFGNFIRSTQWRDITVEVYIKKTCDKKTEHTEN